MQRNHSVEIEYGPIFSRKFESSGPDGAAYSFWRGTCEYHTYSLFVMHATTVMSASTCQMCVRKQRFTRADMRGSERKAELRAEYVIK